MNDTVTGIIIFCLGIFCLISVFRKGQINLSLNTSEESMLRKIIGKNYALIINLLLALFFFTIGVYLIFNLF
jgi:hypothetical protein